MESWIHRTMEGAGRDIKAELSPNWDNWWTSAWFSMELMFLQSSQLGSRETQWIAGKISEAQQERAEKYIWKKLKTPKIYLKYPVFMPPQTHNLCLCFPWPRQCHDPEVPDGCLGDCWWVPDQVHHHGHAFQGRGQQECNIPRKNKLLIRKIWYYVSRVDRHRNMF